MSGSPSASSPKITVDIASRIDPVIGDGLHMGSPCRPPTSSTRPTGWIVISSESNAPSDDVLPQRAPFP